MVHEKVVSKSGFGVGVEFGVVVQCVVFLNLLDL